MTSIKTILQIVLINETGDSYHRMRWPGLHVATQDSSLRVISLDANAKERFVWGEEADLLVLYQCLDHNLLPLIKKRKSLGRKTLVEYNDNFYSPPPCSPVASAWSSPLTWQVYERFMEESDGVIVTGPGLKSLFSSKTKKEIHILENHYPYDLIPLNEIWKEPISEFHLGWAGSLGHMSDFLALLPTIYEIMERYPEVVFNAMGTDSIPSFVHLPKERFRFTPWGGMKEYFAFWEKIHLGIAPLLDSEYNQCRSDIKAIEMTTQGVLPVVSDLLPYRKFLAETGLKSFRSFRECKNLIIKYITDKESLRVDFTKCYEYVRQKRIGSKELGRLSLYRSLLPEESSNYAWPYPAGYFESTGTNTPPPDYPELVSAQSLINEGKLQDSILILKRLISQNPFHADYRLSELKCLIRAKDSSLLTRIEEALRDFPNDLRFVLIRLSQEKNAEGRDKLWHALLKRLQEANTTYRNFFMNDILNLYYQELHSTPEFVHISPKFISLYPNSASLHYEAAMAYEKIRDYEKAIQLFEWLEKSHLLMANNKEFLGGNETSYFTTWLQALRGRIG